MPRANFGEGFPFLERKEILSFEEILRLVRIFVGLGVDKVRLTGGEPLLRRELPLLVAELARVQGLREITLTTNGSLLRTLALPLKQAGLGRLTVSLDSLDPERFRANADSQVPLAQVLEGLEAARSAGFQGTKLNCVLRRGVNEDDIHRWESTSHGPDKLRAVLYNDKYDTPLRVEAAGISDIEPRHRLEHARFPGCGYLATMSAAEGRRH